ncbi:MAG: hypothetical protein ACTSUJ_02790, partial [Candidatus Njordarchaeales archaeon]
LIQTRCFLFSKICRKDFACFRIFLLMFSRIRKHNSSGTFLTIDEEFKNFIRKNNLEEIVIFPEELDRKNEKINPQHS